MSAGGSQSFDAGEFKDAWKAKLTRGEVWCLVSTSWWKQFVQATGFNNDNGDVDASLQKEDGELVLPPIDNSSLQDEHNPRALKTRLAEGSDYVLVTSEMWKLLVACYGLVAPEHAFPRNVVVKGMMQESRLDMYPIFIKFTELDTVTVLPSTVDTQIRCVERSKTLADLRDEYRGINTDKKENWISVSHVDAEPGYEALPSAPATVSEEGEEEEAKHVVRFYTRSAEAAPPAAAAASGGESAGAPGAAGLDDDEGKEKKSGSGIPGWDLLKEKDYEAKLDAIVPPPGMGDGTPFELLVEHRKEDGTWWNEIKEKDWKDFAVGDLIDAADSVKKWYKSSIVDMKENEIKVHFEGWEARWDEWLPKTSERLAKLGTKADKNFSRTTYSSSFSSWGSSDKGKPEARGAVGLRNLGNTCFMASALQCVSNSDLLTSFFLEDDYAGLINRTNPLGWKGRVADEYGAWIKEMWGDEYRVVAPRSLKDAIGEVCPRFVGYNQQDAQELLTWLLDGLHEDLNQIFDKPPTSMPENDGRPDAEVAKESWEVYLKRNKSVVVDYFYGQQRSRLDCPDCSKVSVTFDPMMTLSVPLPAKADKVLKVTVVFEDRKQPKTEFGVTVNKLSSMKVLREEVGKLAGLDPGCLLVADVFMAKIYRVYTDNYSISDIGQTDKTYLYECPAITDIKDREKDAVVLKVINQVVTESSLSLSSFMSAKACGIPKLLAFPAGETLTNAQVCALLQQEVDAFAAADVVPDGDSVANFVVLDSMGGRCGRCTYMKRCMGCTIENNDEPFELRRNYAGQIDISIGIQWTPRCYNVKQDEHQIEDESAKPRERRQEQQQVLTIDDCIQKYVEKEQLGENDPWYCSDCKEFRLATKKLDIWNPPRLLIVHLKRFMYSREVRDKIDTYIDFPLEGLDLAPYVKNPELKKEDCQYDLYGITNHMGGLGGGHYTAYVKNIINGKWYNCDDSSVTEVRDPESTIKTKSAYMLFYKQRTNK